MNGNSITYWNNIDEWYIYIYDCEDNRLNEDEDFEDEYVQLCIHTLYISLMVDYEDIG